MGVKDMNQFLERWEMDVRGVRPADDSGPGAPGTGTMVRPVASDSRLDLSGYRRGAGTGPAHHRQVGRCLRRGRPGGPDIRADRWCPPPSKRRSRRR